MATLLMWFNPWTSPPGTTLHSAIQLPHQVATPRGLVTHATPNSGGDARSTLSSGGNVAKGNVVQSGSNTRASGTSLVAYETKDFTPQIVQWQMPRSGSWVAIILAFWGTTFAWFTWHRMGKVAQTKQLQPMNPHMNGGHIEFAMAAVTGTFELPTLPWAKDALAPHISAETIDYHYGKHHLAYVNKLNELLALPENDKWKDKTLEDMIRDSDGVLFNQAAQIWNHNFYWGCLKPNPDSAPNLPTGEIKRLIEKNFETFEDFKTQFSAACVGHFGAGMCHHAFSRHVTTNLPLALAAQKSK